MTARAFGAILDNEPQFRTRVTIRNPFFANTGHAYDSTVEVEYSCAESDLDEAAEQARVHMRSELRKAREEGIRERDARNTADGR